MSWLRSSRTSISTTNVKSLPNDLQQLFKQSEGIESTLRELDDQTKDIAKATRKVIEANARLNATEMKLATDYRASDYVSQNDELKVYAQQFAVIVNKVEEDRKKENNQLTRLIEDPVKQLSTVVGSQVLDLALKKREDSIGECTKFQREVEKYEAREKAERTGDTVARLSEKRRLLTAAQEDVRIVQKRIVDVLPQLSSAYLDYTTPALISVLRCETDTYGNAARSYTELRNAMLSKRNLIQLKGDANSSYSQLIDEQLAEIRKLSIVSASEN